VTHDEAFAAGTTEIVWSLGRGALTIGP